MGVTLVGRVGFTEDGQPLAAVSKGEEGIGVLRQVVDEGNVKLLRQRQGLTIDACTTDDEHLFLFRLAGGKGGVEGGEDLGSREGKGGVVAQDKVAAIGQGAVGEGLEGFMAHNDGVASSKRLEAFQIIRQMVYKLSCSADGIVLGYGDDEGEHS